MKYRLLYGRCAMGDYDLMEVLIGRFMKAHDAEINAMEGL